MLVISICDVERFHGGIQSIEEVMQETFFEGKALQDIIEKKVPVPGKKHKFYKSSINKSIHFVQRSLSSSTRGQRVIAQLNLSRE